MNKASFRKSSLKRLKEQSTKSRIARDRVIFLILLKLIKNFKFQAILLYLPLPDEFDTRKLIRYLRRKGIILYVPFMGEISFQMVEYRLPLVKKKFGIYEPKSLNFKFPAVDMAVVPIVGVDNSLRRVGFGRGMYDRFFERFNTKPYTVFVQRSLCYSDKRLTESHDVRADLVITPEKIITAKGDRDGSRADSSRNRFSFGRSLGRIYGGKKVKCRQLQNTYRAGKS